MPSNISAPKKLHHQDFSLLILKINNETALPDPICMFHFWFWFVFLREVLMISLFIIIAKSGSELETSKS